MQRTCVAASVAPAASNAACCTASVSVDTRGTSDENTGPNMNAFQFQLLCTLVTRQPGWLPVSSSTPSQHAGHPAWVYLLATTGATRSK